MKKEPSILNSIKVLVTPWDKGFTCGIVNDQSHMTTEEYELCTTICRGMIHRAMTNPHQTFMDGMKGFAEDRKQKKKEKVICNFFFDRKNYYVWLKTQNAGK